MLRDLLECLLSLRTSVEDLYHLSKCFFIRLALKDIAAKRRWQNHLGKRSFTPTFLNFQGRLTRSARHEPYRFNKTSARITASSLSHRHDYFYQGLCLRRTLTDVLVYDRAT